MKSFLLLISLALASCSTKSTGSAATPVSATDSKKVVKKAPKPKPYPLQTCLVTGDGLDDMDERVTTVHEGQTFEFCCKPCLKKFNKNPAKYVKALAKATD
jgi:YHS domain-containing protein